MTDKQAKSRVLTKLQWDQMQSDALVKHMALFYVTREAFDASTVEERSTIKRNFEAGFMAGVEFATKYVGLKI